MQLVNYRLVQPENPQVPLAEGSQLDDILNARVGSVWMQKAQGMQVSEWRLQRAMNVSLDEGGSKTQMVVVLETDDKEFHARVKLIRTIHEAINYYNISTSNDSLKNYLPEFLGVLDRNGNPINLEAELQAYTPEQLIEKYQDVYLVMKDLVQQAQKDGVLPELPKDFKFAKPSLIENNEELVRHKHPLEDVLYRFFRRIYFSFSDSSFAFQKGKKISLLLTIINCLMRLFAIRYTSLALRDQFQGMSLRKLKRKINFLGRLKENIRKSQFVFVDASMLFVPTKSKRGKKDLKIHLIDLEHAIRRDEGISGFDQMKKETQESIDELVQLAEAEAERLSPRPFNQKSFLPISSR